MQLVVKGTERHDAIGGHVLGFVGVGFDLGLGLLLTRGALSVVVDLGQDMVQGGVVLKYRRGLLIQSIDDLTVGGTKVFRRA